MKNRIKSFVLAGLLGCQFMVVMAQGLPTFSINRRAEETYMDSLSALAKQQYTTLSALPSTARTDTLRFKTLHFLGTLYKWWFSRRDSVLYYSNALIAQARKSGNLFYEINGKLTLEEYYHSRQLNTPQALRLDFEMLALIPQTPFYEVVRLRILLNMGDLYSISGDYLSARRYLNQAQQLLTHPLTYASTQTTNSFRMEVEQRLGAIYKQEDNFTESEKHYLAAEAIIQKNTFATGTNQGFIYDDLGELYLKYGRYQQALYYTKKAEAIWDRIKTPNESHSWGTLACIYAGLGQDELAIQYARKVLGLPKPNKFIREQAYMGLYQAYEHRQDWKNTALYYKLYSAIGDTIINDRHSLELIAIQKQADYDRLKQLNQQTQQLQTQRLLTMQKQAELDRLRASATADALLRKARFSDQQRLLDNERAQTSINRQQTAHRLQQQAFQQQALQHETQTQQNWLRFITSLSVLLLVLLLLLFSLFQLRKRKAETERRLATERANVDMRIMQTQEDERARLAADLHDDLGGTLATLHRHLADLRPLLHDPLTLQAFQTIQPLMRKSSADLRRIAHNLMPPEFERIGLRHALEQLIHNQPSQPTRFSFFASGLEQKLPLATELNAYRIVSELIHNVHKHAQAQRAAVQLLYQADTLRITVEDDGLGNRGPLPTDAAQSAGMGLKSSVLRAEYIGAVLWREVSEAGTLVVLDIPYLRITKETRH